MTAGLFLFFSAAGALLIIAALVLWWWLANQPRPSQENPQPNKPISQNQPSSDETPESDTPKKDEEKKPDENKPATNNGGVASGGSQGSGDSGSSGGGSTPDPCASTTANHVAGGADGTGKCWPGPSNTGIPTGTVLTAYTGGCEITTANTVIDSKTVNCDLEIHASNVTIKNSKVNGLVFIDLDLPGSSGWSLNLIDSEVDGGQQERAAVSVGNVNILRANIHGGITAVQCEEHNVSCIIRDSYLHGQYIPDDQPWHLGGFLSDGGQGIEIVHNFIICDHAANSVGDGCTGDLNFIPNFAPISGALVEHNLFGANVGSSYCTYGGEKSTSPTPHSDHIVYKDNIFQRGTNGLCGQYGPVTDFDINQPGNQWVNNRWADGAIIDAP